MLKTIPSVASLLAALGATNALGQTIVPGDVVVPPGGTLIVSDDTTYTGSLTIGAGAQVVVDAGFELAIGTGATLAVNGTEGEPVMFFPINDTWEGLKLEPGSSADIDYAMIVDFLVAGIETNDADVSLKGVEIFDSSTAPTAAGIQTRFAVFAKNGGSVSIDRSTIGPISALDGANGSNGGDGGTNSNGGSGGSGSPGGDVTGIHADGIDSIRLTSTLIYGLEAGRGGNGGRGGRGGSGSDGSNGGSGDNGADGRSGRTGGRGGDGGRGGGVTVAFLEGVNEITIAQNIIDRLSGGEPGSGNTGGSGGRGGDGGDGGDGGTFQDGGDGGDGGNGGRGGEGGRGGVGGTLEIFTIQSPGSEPIITNNTVYQANAVAGGAGGNGGNRGFGGTRGVGGDGGFLAGDGNNGTSGGSGQFGSDGVGGANGVADAVFTQGAAPTGFAARLHNNIFSFAGPGARRVAQSVDTGIIDITTNAFSGFSTLSIGPVVGALAIVTDAPTFVDVASGDFTPASAFLIDAADNSYVPAALTTDLLGNPRFADELSTPNTGIGDEFIVDYGAIEVEGDSAQPSICPSDLAAPFGLLDLADIDAFIIGFLAGDAVADLVAPFGIVDLSDLDAFIVSYVGGCP
ncbi:MAG: GC-type dockerin domain-anchored protein [Planctomycetota bacterium]